MEKQTKINFINKLNGIRNVLGYNNNPFTEQEIDRLITELSGSLQKTIETGCFSFKLSCNSLVAIPNKLILRRALI